MVLSLNDQILTQYFKKAKRRRFLIVSSVESNYVISNHIGFQPAFNWLLFNWILRLCMSLNIPLLYEGAPQSIITGIINHRSVCLTTLN